MHIHVDPLKVALSQNCCMGTCRIDRATLLADGVSEAPRTSLLPPLRRFLVGVVRWKAEIRVAVCRTTPSHTHLAVARLCHCCAPPIPSPYQIIDRAPHSPPTINYLGHHTPSPSRGRCKERRVAGWVVGCSMAVRLSSGDGWWNVRSVCQHQIVGAAMVVGCILTGFGSSSAAIAYAI